MVERDTNQMFHFWTCTGETTYRKMELWHSLELQLENVDLFPNKNKCGQVLTVGAFNNKPYIHIGTMSGMELKMVESYANRFNMRMFVVDYKHDKWGVINDNYTGTGMLGGILNNTVDIGIGGYFLQGPKLLYMDFVSPSTRVGITCLVPAPRLSTNYLLIIEPFTITTWILVLTTIIVFNCVLCFWGKYMNRAFNVNKIALFTVRTYLQQSGQLPGNPQLKYIIGQLLFFSLVMNVTYFSKLFGLMTHPRYTDLIETLDDLDLSGYKWGATHKSFADPLRTEANQHLLLKFFVDTEENLINRLRTNNIAIVLERLKIGYVLSEKIRSDDLIRYTVMTNDLYWIYGALILPKNSVLQPSLYRHLLDVRETGLVHHWEAEAFRQESINLQMELKMIHTEKHFGLTPHDLLAVFNLWLIGSGISIASFLVELCWPCLNK